LQSRPRPHNYTRRSVRAHIPVPARNVRAHIPVSAASVRAHRTVCAIGVHARPSFPSAPAFPLSPTGSAPDIPYAPLHPRSLPRRRGGPGGSQRGQGKSDLPWPPINERLTLIGRARRSIGRTRRADGQGERPAPQTTLELTWLLYKGVVAQLSRKLFIIAHMLPLLPLV
jgi:hypothetical protein